MKSSKSASPLVLGPASPVFPGPFKKNLSALFRINGEKVQFTQMKHAWAHMVQVKHKSKDGIETDLKLHFYTEILAPEYDNIVCDECRIMGTNASSRSLLTLSGAMRSFPNTMKYGSRHSISPTGSLNTHGWNKLLAMSHPELRLCGRTGCHDDT